MPEQETESEGTLEAAEDAAPEGVAVGRRAEAGGRERRAARSWSKLSRLNTIS